MVDGKLLSPFWKLGLRRVCRRDRGYNVVQQLVASKANKKFNSVNERADRIRTLVDDMWTVPREKGRSGHNGIAITPG